MKMGSLRLMVREAQDERFESRSSWGERTPPTNKLASGIVVLSVDSWIILNGGGCLVPVITITQVPSLCDAHAMIFV